VGINCRADPLVAADPPVGPPAIAWARYWLSEERAQGTRADQADVRPRARPTASCRICVDIQALTSVLAEDMLRQMIRIEVTSLFLAALPALAQLPPVTRDAIDAAVKKTLAASGVASASIAVVKDAKVAYAHAYGDARLDPRTPATPAMRYKIGSNTKQFTAAAALLLREQGKLSLDDSVAKYFPGLTRANQISIRQLLSHTSGYEDYYPLDYVAPFMARKTTPRAIVDFWAKKPLNFDPGTRWQYSNTNYVIAGQIVEKASGMPLFDFLRQKVFDRLQMHSAIDVDRDTWSPQDPVGYTRFALGPSRPAKSEGSGWADAAGELAMSAGDLALWDISLMNGSILKPESLRALTTEVLLKNGAGTGYALGLGVSNRDGHRIWAHGGGVAGFISRNITLPDDRISITVFTNQDDPAAARMAQDIEQILIAPPADPQAASSLETARRIFQDLQQGKFDRGQFTADANAYFTPQAVADFTASLSPLGAATSLVQTRAGDRGGMRYRDFSIRTASRPLSLSTFTTPDGKLAQYLIHP
jgi:D-alanyl-D-alanine carboxypeptidase